MQALIKSECKTAQNSEINLSIQKINQLYKIESLVFKQTIIAKKSKKYVSAYF